jgi:TonB family protein
MTMRRHGRRAVSSLLLLLPLARTAAAQPSLVDAKQLYFTASYEQSLAVLNRLKEGGPQPGADALGVEEYRAFCLVALGQSTEAVDAFEAIVTAEPLHQLDESASPRLHAMFREVRQRSLPTAVQQAYRTAKATYERGEYAAAATQFERVLAILDDPDMAHADKALLDDLRTLAAGFLRLSATTAKPSEAPPVSQPAVEPTRQAEPATRNVEPPRTNVEPVEAARPAPSQGPPRIYAATDAGVTPPVTLHQELPPWPSVALLPSGGRGVLELVIDERGQVESATIRQSVNALYDGLLLDAARAWRYKAALKDGKPVKFRKFLQIALDAQGNR